MSLKIVQRRAGSVVILDFEGKIILGEPSNRLLETTKNLIGQGERNFLFNLAQVAYIDSSGLGIFVQCHGSVLRRQGCIKLLNVPGNIRELLRATKLESLFEIFDEERTAVQSYN